MQCSELGKKFLRVVDFKVGDGSRGNYQMFVIKVIFICYENYCMWGLLCYWFVFDYSEVIRLRYFILFCI